MNEQTSELRKLRYLIFHYTFSHQVVSEIDNMNNFQRIFDAQIINGKIKKAYLYQRDISDRERK